MQYYAKMHIQSYIHISMPAEAIDKYSFNIVLNIALLLEQQFHTLSCLHYTIFSVVKLDLCIRIQFTLLLDLVLAREKTTRKARVHLV